MTKIISISKFTGKPLTSLMVKTLRAACEMQRNHEPFGQKDLNGSFNALLQREFIAAKTITLHGKQEVIWFVTASGQNILRNLGFSKACYASII